jgi:hypothetical protein
MSGALRGAQGLAQLQNDCSRRVGLKPRGDELPQKEEQIA